jgi:hypothetical protein
MESMAVLERYYIKTRDVVLDRVDAERYGIRRVYNYTSCMEFMGVIDLEKWGNGLKRGGSEEAIIIESAVKEVNGEPLYISSCIVFHTVEMSNIYYMKCMRGYKHVEGFYHLYN